MGAWLRSLPPAQRTALLVGVPVVALVVLVQLVRRPKAPVEVEEDTSDTPGGTIPNVVLGSGGAAGVAAGELQVAFSALTGALLDQGEMLDAIREAQARQTAGTPVAAGTSVTVGGTGETWRQLLVRHYRSTNLWGPVRAARQNAALLARYPSIDARLPAGAVVFMSARNW